MLYIKNKIHSSDWATWSTGERFPPITPNGEVSTNGRVVTLQADGDELQVILDALNDNGNGCCPAPKQCVDGPSVHYHHRKVR